jgi:hypothetical protein
MVPGLVPKNPSALLNMIRTITVKLNRRQRDHFIYIIELNNAEYTWELR